MGFEIARSPRGSIISQRSYALQLLQDMGYLGTKPASTPMDVNLKLSNDEGDLLEDQRLIGKLLYLIITCPDLSYSMNELSQFLVQPRTPHMVAAQRVLQYIKGNPGQGLFYPSWIEVQLKAYAKAELQNIQLWN